MESNHRMSESKSDAVPLGESPKINKVMIESTTKYRDLTINEEKNLFTELVNAPNHLWQKHATDLSLTALKEGCSLHLYFIDTSYNIVSDNTRFFPNTMKFISSILPNQYGRIYWHKLEKNQEIKLHNDMNVVKNFNNKLHTRYQVYLEVPKKFKMILDNKPILNTFDFSNGIFEFALQKNHYYKNLDDDTFYILVFDFMK